MTRAPPSFLSELFIPLLLFPLLLPVSFSDVFLPTRTIRVSEAPNVIRALTTLTFEAADADARTDAAEDERVVDRHILPGEDGCLFLVALSSGITPASQDLMSLAGVRVLRSIPERSFLVFAQRSVVSAMLLSGPNVVWAGKLLGSDKLESRLLVDLSKEASTSRFSSSRLFHLIVTFAALDELPLAATPQQEQQQQQQQPLDIIGKLMRGLSDQAKRDSISIDRISLYSRRVWQVLIEMPGTAPIVEKLKTLHWLSGFCEISSIASAESAAPAWPTQPLQIEQVGAGAMLRGG